MLFLKCFIVHNWYILNVTWLNYTIFKVLIYGYTYDTINTFKIMSISITENDFIMYVCHPCSEFFLITLSQRTTDLFSVTIDCFVYLEFREKEPYIVYLLCFFFYHLACLSSFVITVENINRLFHFIAGYSSIDWIYQYIHSFVDGYLGYFQF